MSIVPKNYKESVICRNKNMVLNIVDNFISNLKCNSVYQAQMLKKRYSIFKISFTAQITNYVFFAMVQMLLQIRVVEKRLIANKANPFCNQLGAGTNSNFFTLFFPPSHFFIKANSHSMPNCDFDRKKIVFVLFEGFFESFQTI